MYLFFASAQVILTFIWCICTIYSWQLTITAREQKYRLITKIIDQSQHRAGKNEKYFWTKSSFSKITRSFILTPVSGWFILENPLLPFLRVNIPWFKGQALNEVLLYSFGYLIELCKIRNDEEMLE